MELFQGKRSIAHRCGLHRQETRLLKADFDSEGGAGWISDRR
jgi:hypothetical protein